MPCRCAGVQWSAVVRRLGIDVDSCGLLGGRVAVLCGHSGLFVANDLRHGVAAPQHSSLTHAMLRQHSIAPVCEAQQHVSPSGRPVLPVTCAAWPHASMAWGRQLGLLSSSRTHPPVLPVPVQLLKHPWLNSVAPNNPLGNVVLTRLRNFSRMNKFKRRVLHLIASGMQATTTAPALSASCGLGCRPL